MDKSTWECGELGEKIFSQWCELTNRDCTPASKNDNLLKGIDFHAALEPGGEIVDIDVKYTDKLYFFRLSNETAFVRHPFRKETQSQYYAFVSIKNDKPRADLITVESMLEKCCLNPGEFKQFLEKFDFISLKELQQQSNSVSLAQTLYRLKLQFLPYLRPGYSIIYLENQPSDIPFYIEKTKAVKPSVLKRNEAVKLLQGIKAKKVVTPELVIKKQIKKHEAIRIYKKQNNEASAKISI